MTVEAAPAPPVAADEAEYSEDRVHTGLFWLAIFSLIFGLIGITASRAWASHAQSLITFPRFDQTMVLRGQVGYHTDPTTLLPLSSVSTAALEDRLRVATVSSVDKRALLLSTEAISVGGGRTLLMSQYMVDVTDLHNLHSPQAWSYAPSNAADRSAAYSVNLPFDSAGPQSVWMNPVDRAVVFTPVGQASISAGVNVVRMQGHVDAAPVDPLYVTALARAGLPAGATLEQLLPTLRSLGANLDHSFIRALQVSMTGEEIDALAKPVPFDYTMTGDTTLLVEPRAGTIVSIETSNNTYAAHLDAGALQSLSALLAAHRAVPGVSEALPLLQRLATAAPATMFDMSYGQTPASLRSLTGYAGAQRDWINRMTRVIPTTMLAVGITLMGVSVLAGLTAWRRRHDVVDEWT